MKPIQYNGGNKAKRITAFALAVLMAGVMTACVKNSVRTSKETDTEIVNEIDTDSNGNINVTHSNKQEYTVYRYSKQNLLGMVGIDAAIGEEFELALNDALAKDAYSALEGDFNVELNENTTVKPEDKVMLMSITYVDADGKVKTTSKKGLKVEDLDVKYDESGKEEGIAYGISLNGKDTIGYVSYVNNERHLVQDVTIESLDSVAPDGYTYSESYTVSSFSDPVSGEPTIDGEPYIIK